MVFKKVATIRAQPTAGALFAAIEQSRGDYNGRVLSIRAEILRSRATLYDRSEVSADGPPPLDDRAAPAGDPMFEHAAVAATTRRAELGKISTGR